MSAIVQVFRVLASMLSVIMYLSPIPTLRKMYLTKSTGHMPFVPLVTMISKAHVWAVYGLLDHDIVPIFVSSAFGMVVSILYAGIYYHYSTERSYTIKWIAIVAIATVVLTLYPILGIYGYTNQSYDGVRLTVGYIAATSSVVMYTSPFEKIPLVLKHRCGVFIPIDLVATGCVNSLTWVIYSLLKIDWQLFVPNAILLVIGLIQVAVYYAYNPATHPLQEEETKELEDGYQPLSPTKGTSPKGTTVDPPV